MVPQQLEMVETLPANDTEAAILKHLTERPLRIDKLCRCSSLPISVVSSALTMTELKGIVYQHNLHYNIAKG